jgi:hypothetical protein
MVKSGLACCVFAVVVLVTLAAQNQPNAKKNNPVTLKYLGAAGWEIADRATSILIDPYLSRINGPQPPGGHSMAGDTRRAYGWGDVASPDGRPSMRTCNAQTSFSLLIHIATTSWMFLTSL